MDQRLLQYVVPGVVLAVVLTLRLRGMRKARPLEANRLLWFPVLLVAVAVFVIGANPPSLFGLSLCLFALVVGGLAGWQRGRMIRIERDPATGRLMQQASPAAMILLVVIIAIRFAARAYFVGGSPAGSAAGMDSRTLMITDVMLAFAVGLLSVTRIELFLRAKRILAAPTMPLPGAPA